jgi:hypothetical protein
VIYVFFRGQSVFQNHLLHRPQHKLPPLIAQDRAERDASTFPRLNPDGAGVTGRFALTCRMHYGNFIHYRPEVRRKSTLLMKKSLQPAVILLLLSSFAAPLATAHAQGTAFTYQGHLNDGSGPANGTYDVQFTLYPTNVTGSALAGPVTNSATAVSNGLFTSTIDFGSGVFTGTNCWLDVAVRTNGADGFTELTPRQPVTPVPYAIFANTASNLIGTLPAAQLPAGVLTNGASGINLSGTFTGDGSGLTNVSGPTKTWESIRVASVSYPYNPGGGGNLDNPFTSIGQMSITQSGASGTYLVQYNAVAYCSSGSSQWIQIASVIDSTTQSNGGTFTFLPTGGYASLSGSFVINNLSAGTHTFTFEFNASSSAVSLYGSTYFNGFSATVVRIQ